MDVSFADPSMASLVVITSLASALLSSKPGYCLTSTDDTVGSIAEVWTAIAIIDQQSNCQAVTTVTTVAAREGSGLAFLTFLSPDWP
jgi:hypothetical protein